MKIVMLEDEDIVLSQGSLRSRGFDPWWMVAFVLGFLLARAYYLIPWTP